MSDAVVRTATAQDQTGIQSCVNAAYEMYLTRMDRSPAPMLADYGALIADGDVYVIGEDGIQALIVLKAHGDHLFIENVAVHPDYQGFGLGRRMIEFAEDQARKRGLNELRLYTNELMVENLGYYGHLGFEITDRRVEDGYHRVYMRKRIQKSKSP